MRKSYKSKVLVRRLSDPVTITCNYCKFLARDNNDLASIYKHNACTECYTTFYNEINRNIHLTKEVVRDRMNIFIEEV